MTHSRNMVQELTLEDIRENIVIIKINKSYRGAGNHSLQ